MARITAVLLGGAAVSSAHQPYESSAVARLDRERLELTITTSAEIAGHLVGEPMAEAAALENLRPRLLKAGAELYEVTAMDQPLQPERVFITQRVGEAVFSIIYPVARPTELRFRAAYLNKLPLGYRGSIEVFDEAGKLLGSQRLLKKGETKDMFSVQLPAASSHPVDRMANPQAPAEALKQSQTAAASGQVGVASKRDVRLLFIGGVCAILFLAVGIAWQFRRSPS